MMDEPEIDPQGRCDQCGRMVMTRKYAAQVSRLVVSRVVAHFWAWLFSALFFALLIARMLT